MTKTKLVFTVIFFIIGINSFLAQKLAVSTIHKIEPIENHYAQLQKLSSVQRPSYDLMDTITYPQELYKNNTLLFALIEPNYLTSSQVDFLVNSMKFPANSSEQTRAELDYLLKLQKNRTKEQIEKVLTLAKVGYWPDSNHVSTHKYYKKNLENLFFECKEVIGENCTAENYPNTSSLLKGVMNDMRLMEFAVKYKLLRARPYQLEKKLEPLKNKFTFICKRSYTMGIYPSIYFQ